jgi:hypothetical protein
VTEVAGYFIAAFTAVAGLQAQSPVRAEVKVGYQAASGNILNAPEKMPEEDYGFKPTPDIRTFGPLIAHVPPYTAETAPAIPVVLYGTATKCPEIVHVIWPAAAALTTVVHLTPAPGST